MASTYTLRYSNEAGLMIRLLMIQCKDDQDALERAASTMPSPYATLVINAGNKLVWRGTKAKVIEWTSSSRPLSSHTTGAS